MNIQDIKQLVAENKLTLRQAYIRVYKNSFVENESFPNEEFHATFADIKLAFECIDNINSKQGQFATFEMVIPGIVEIED